MSRTEQDTHHAYWIITADPNVMACVGRMYIPGEVLVAEQTKQGIDAVFYVEYIGDPEDDYEFLVTLDAFLTMGARIRGTLPARKAPPEDN